MLLKLVILSLACWRISAFISYEDAPFDLMLKFREWIGIKHDIDGLPFSVEDTQGGRFVFEIAEMVSCVWCLSFWIGLALTLLFLMDYEWWYLMPFVLSAGAIGWEGLVNNGNS